MKKSIIAKGIVLCLLLTLILTFLSGCGGGNKSGDNSQEPSIAYYSYFSEPVTDWDPSVEGSSGYIVLNNIYETLLRYDPVEDKFINVLATNYTKSADGLTWTFDIRKGVKFHDGSEVNAEAVKFSIDRTKQLGKGLSYIWDPVDQINVINDYQAEFKLKYPAPLDLIASSSTCAFIMSPKTVSSQPDDWLSQGHEAGSGPYMLESQTMGQEVIMTKFPDYRQGWNGQHFDKAVVAKNSETSTRRQMVEKGDADITMTLPAEDLASLKNNPDVEVKILPSFENIMLFFNTENKVLSDKTLRQALSYAFPYEDVIKYAFGDLAKRANGPIPAGMWGHGDKLFQYQYDLTKAKELLAQAGYPNGGFKLELTYQSGDEERRKIAELYKAELAKLNIDLEVQAMPWESQWAKAKNPDPKDRQDIFLMGWWPDIPSPYSWLFSLFHTEKDIFFNLDYYKNPEFDTMIDEANSVSGIDREKATELFIKAQEILIDDAPVIYAGDKQYVYVLNKSFKGHTYNPAYSNVVWFYDAHRE